MKTRTGMSSSLLILSKLFWQCFSSWQDVYRVKSCTGLSNCQHWTLFSVEDHYFRICWRNIGGENNFLGSNERFSLNVAGFFFFFLLLFTVFRFVHLRFGHLQQDTWAHSWALAEKLVLWHTSGAFNQCSQEVTVLKGQYRGQHCSSSSQNCLAPQSLPERCSWLEAMSAVLESNCHADSQKSGNRNVSHYHCWMTLGWIIIY